MKLVHLAPRNVIGRIRRNGLRMGRGVRGRGVYSVPLFQIMEQQEGARLYSSMDMWRGLFCGSDKRGRQCAAVVFTAPPSCWPAELYFCFSPHQARMLLGKLDTGLLPGLSIDSAQRQWLEETAARGYCCSDAGVVVKNHGALGRFLTWLFQTGWSPVEAYSEEIELVFRCPVPPGAIERIFPLYRKDAKFRVQREQALFTIIDE